MEREDEGGDREAVFLAAVADLGPASTREIANAVGCSRRAADYRLRMLYADGKLQSTAIGRELLWRLADDVAAREAASG